MIKTKLPKDKCPFKGQLFLAGYAQSSIPGELISFLKTLLVRKIS